MIDLILLLTIKCSIFANYYTFERETPTVSLLFIKLPTHITFY